MPLSRLSVLIAFVLVLGVPFLFRPASAERDPDALKLTILTPHNAQIRAEFSRAFDQWHRANYDGQGVVIDWRQPGGTSEIRKMLTSIYTKALQSGQLDAEGNLTTGVMPYDMLFGGGSYEFNQVKRGVTATPDGMDEAVTISISRPLPFTDAELEAWYGENRIGAEPLYDPDKHWIGAATSGFGIVFNRDVLRQLGLSDPTSWYDMTDPALAGWVALADPRQSGSVETTYDSILSNYGWDEGWRILRGMCANARYFANGSKKVPLDVTQGEAGMGVSIDFYGRYQAQSVMREGESPDDSRVGYVDPPGVVYIDPDPIAVLRGAPHEELAVRFARFVVSEQGQALWQFHASPEADAASEDPADWGPAEFELRRMPARRVMYAEHSERFVDDVNPFVAASETAPKGWRGSIKMIMGSCAIDIHHEQVSAWEAMHAAGERGADISAMEELFYAMPEHEFVDGRGPLVLSEENYREIYDDWRAARGTPRYDEIRIRYTAFFRNNYERIREMASGAGETL